MTEKEKMLAGLPYSAVDTQLLKELNECKDVVYRYNQLLPSKRAERTAMLKDLLGHVDDDNILINQPFFCDYGSTSAWANGSLPTSISRCLTRRW